MADDQPQPTDEQPTDEQPQPPEDEQPDEQPPADDDTPEDDEHDGEDDDDTPETFPRAYVLELRRKGALYRTRARDMENRAVRAEHALLTERVASLDVLADPSDVPYDPKLLDDPDALRDAVDDLVQRKPHLRKRGTTTGTGAHQQHDGSDGVSLLGLMRRGS